MKKNGFLLLMLMAGLLLVSCKKDTLKEWERFSDFTLDDIRGTYSFSNVDGVFDNLTENEYCHLCTDAQITISPYLGSETSIDFNVKCPSQSFNRSFTGRPAIDEDSSLLNMTVPSTSLHPDFELTAYVYKNAKGDVRLHGLAREVYYNVDQGVYSIKYKVNYYFDVLK